jgi:DNA gyrase subunit A
LLQNTHLFESSPVRLFSSADRESEFDDDDDIPFEEDYSATPRTEKESYVTEATQAEQANNLLLAMKTTNENQHVELQTELSNSFLQYALSIIMGRAIPDARDGLKPVHRRILFAMHELQLLSSTPHRKCARVVGDVLGKLHPHGDTAVYDALVRMAQDFTTNHPLIDGHGNFGSIDADPAAAMRYTECRLTPLAQHALLADLESDTVDSIPNFDGTSTEPVVLPAKIPVLLLNGSSGIAVGMATNVPPHNLRELLTACIALTNARMNTEANPVSDQKLLKIIPGPDFPTGGVILGTEGAQKLYTTGNGGIVMRAVTQIESFRTTGKSERTAIIVTELPYQVNKAALLEKIAGLVNEKKLEGISDLRDESSGRDGIRVVIELKRDAVAAVVLANLYQKTALQSTFAGNFLALMKPKDDSSSKTGMNNSPIVPQRFTLRQALDSFLDFRFETTRRKAQFQLTKVVARAHIVDGLLVALDKIDRVIEVVRAASNNQEARKQLQNDLLGTSDEQTDAILKLQLGQLTRLNKGKLEDEKTTLNKSKDELTQLVRVDEAVYRSMTSEFQELSDKYSVARKTQIILDDDGTVEEIDLIRNSRSVIVVTRGGYIKRMPLKTFESQGRGTRGKRGTSPTSADTDEENEVAHCFTCNDHDTLLMVTDSGIAFNARAFQIPTSSRTAKGQPIPSVLPQLRTADVITTILPISDFSVPDQHLVLATEKGWIKRTPLAAFENLTSRGLTVAKLDEGDRLLWCQRCNDDDDILIGSSMGKATRFSAKNLRPTGRTSRGVRSMNLREGDTIADVDIVSGSSNGSVGVNGDSTAITDTHEYILAISSRGFGTRLEKSSFRTQGRGGSGVVALKFKKSSSSSSSSSNTPNDRLTCLKSVKETDEILVITKNGIMVRQNVTAIPSQGRAATGVLIQKLDEGDEITRVSIVPEYEETD